MTILHKKEILETCGFNDDSKTLKDNYRFLERWSGQRDLNSRPSGPKPDALARLRYAPKKLLETEKFMR